MYVFLSLEGRHFCYRCLVTVFIPFMSQSSASSTVYFTHSFPFVLDFLFLLYLCINPVLDSFWLWLIFKCGECSWSANYRKFHGGLGPGPADTTPLKTRVGMSDCPPAPTSSAGNTLLPAGASCPVALFLLLHVKQGLRPTLFASEDVTLSLKACMTYSLLGSSCWWSCAPPSRQLQLRLTLCPVSLELQCVSLSFSSFFPLFFFFPKEKGGNVILTLPFYMWNLTCSSAF